MMLLMGAITADCGVRMISKQALVPSQSVEYQQGREDFGKRFRSFFFVMN